MVQRQVHRRQRFHHVGRAGGRGDGAGGCLGDHQAAGRRNRDDDRCRPVAWKPADAVLVGDDAGRRADRRAGDDVARPQGGGLREDRRLPPPRHAARPRGAGEVRQEARRLPQGEWHLKRKERGGERALLSSLAVRVLGGIR